MSTLLLERFNKFWNIHPARNGRKVGKPEAKKKFLKLNDKDSILIIQATKNYAISKDVKDGIGIRDPHRFIRDGKGNERWREYINKLDKREVQRQESIERPVKRMCNPDSSPMSMREILVAAASRATGPEILPAWRAVQIFDKLEDQKKRKENARKLLKGKNK